MPGRPGRPRLAPKARTNARPPAPRCEASSPGSETSTPRAAGPARSKSAEIREQAAAPDQLDPLPEACPQRPDHGARVLVEQAGDEHGVGGVARDLPRERRIARRAGVVEAARAATCRPSVRAVATNERLIVAPRGGAGRQDDHAFGAQGLRLAGKRGALVVVGRQEAGEAADAGRVERGGQPRGRRHAGTRELGRGRGRRDHRQGPARGGVGRRDQPERAARVVRADHREHRGRPRIGLAVGAASRRVE